jgi:hypothetical protein
MELLVKLMSDAVSPDRVVDKINPVRCAPPPKFKLVKSTPLNVYPEE